MIDQTRTGKFIAAKRKEQNLTQKQLADMLGISDKTISKWECGHGMPDHSIILELCSALATNVNELLSGEEITEESYTRKAEENMIGLMNETMEQRKKNKWSATGTVAAGVLLAVGLVYLPVMSGGVWMLGNMIDVPSLLAQLIISGLVIWLAGYFFDLLHGIRAVFGKKENETDLQRYCKAFDFAAAVNLLVGMMGTFVAAVSIFLSGPTEMELLEANLAVAVLMMIYAAVLVLFFLLCKGRLVNR